MDAMMWQFIFAIASIFLFVIFVLFSIVNWRAFILRACYRRRNESFIPILGGIAGMFAILLFPWDIGLKSLPDYVILLPIVIDAGTVPGLTLDVLQHIKDRVIGGCRNRKDSHQ